MKMENLRFVSPDKTEIAFSDWTHQSKFGVKWEICGKTQFLDIGYYVGIYPTPRFDGVLIVYPDYEKSPFKSPNNAAIYNADSSLRFQLKAPKPLSRRFPGYVHTPEQIAQMAPEGFQEVGWNVNDFGELCHWEDPFLMWTNIRLHCDVYERRYFDPDTGEFDLEHFHTARY